MSEKRMKIFFVVTFVITDILLAGSYCVGAIDLSYIVGCVLAVIILPIALYRANGELTWEHVIGTILLCPIGWGVLIGLALVSAFIPSSKLD